MTNYNREVAYRMYSTEIRDLEVVPRSDEDYATQYFRLKTGELVNRIFLVGTLLECEDIGTDIPFWKLKISDPKGVFHANIGQYSPIQVQNTVEDLEYPCFVAIVAKIKSHEYNERMQFNLAVESINKVDSRTYDLWCAETERLTKERQDNNE